MEELKRQLTELRAQAAPRGQQQLHQQPPGAQLPQAGNMALVPQVTNRAGGIQLKDVKPTLPKFNVEDPARPLAPWLLNLEQVGEIHGWTPLEMVLAAKQ